MLTSAAVIASNEAILTAMTPQTRLPAEQHDGDDGDDGFALICFRSDTKGIHRHSLAVSREEKVDSNCKVSEVIFRHKLPLTHPSSCRRCVEGTVLKSILKC